MTAKRIDLMTAKPNDLNPFRRVAVSPRPRVVPLCLVHSA
jgi:hypothetical protein